MKIAAVIAAILLGGWLLHLWINRLFERGRQERLASYSKKASGPGSVGNFFLEMQTFLEPDKRHVVEIGKRHWEEQDGEGEGGPVPRQSTDDPP